MGKLGYIYEFGTFKLDTGAHRLLRDNTPFSLAPKSFELLQVLIENCGLAMRKSELLDAVWPDTQVEEGNLAFQVSVLRKALGSEAGSWIETIPRHGYRFSAPVVVHPAAGVTAPALSAGVAVPLERKRHLPAAVLFLVVVVIIAATMFIMSG